MPCRPHPPPELTEMSARLLTCWSPLRIMYIWETIELLLCMRVKPSYATRLGEKITVWSRATCCPGFPPFLPEGSKVLQVLPVLLVKSVCLSSMRSPSCSFQWVAPEWRRRSIWVIWVRTSGSVEQLQASLIHQTYSKWCFPTNHSTTDFNVFLVAWNIAWTDLKLYASHNNRKINQEAGEQDRKHR